METTNELMLVATPPPSSSTALAATSSAPSTPTKCLKKHFDDTSAANENKHAKKDYENNLEAAIDVQVDDLRNTTSEMTPTPTTTTISNGTTACPYGSHHYHYIDYPAAYYQRKRCQNASGAAAAMSQNFNASNAYHYCACSCACESHMQMAVPTQSTNRKTMPKEAAQQQRQHCSSIAADVVVHQQSVNASASTASTAADDDDCANFIGEHAFFRSRSEQSLNSHAYQVLNVPSDKQQTFSNSCRSKLNLLHNHNVDCNCLMLGQQQQQQHRHHQHQHHHHHSQQQHRKSKNNNNNTTINTIDGALTESILATADEITVSESDNNGTMTKRKNIRESRVHKKINSWYEKNYNCNHIEIYSDGDGNDEIDLNHHQSDSILVDDDDAPTANILDQRPPLPPRPTQPSSSPNNGNGQSNAHRPGSHSVKKYVIWCLICGGFSCLLGALFLGVYFLLHSYTITVGNFETVPTFVPATLLILTGVCIMSLARRRNRYSYLIKLSGACGLISALTCALVTVTTTVLHMSRLQALRECEYAQKTRTCTCYSDMIESQVDRVDKEGVRLVFDSLSDCGVVHGSLYSCLRAIFGLSVAGVLTSVFSCMLVYQLLSHERKKMYWEQLELRCRSLYSTHQSHHQHQPSHASAAAAAAAAVPPHAISSTIASLNARNAICRCCEQCHAHRQMQMQASATYPWPMEDVSEPRFWAGTGPPGNFYSPNPCGGNSGGGHGDVDSMTHEHGSNRSNRHATGWSWPRMPWQRSANNNTTSSSSNNNNSNRFRQVPSSPDSQYGFSSANAATLSLAPNASGQMTGGAAVGIGDDDATAAALAAVAAAAANQRAAQVFNMNANANLPYGVWGPPPPYSDPNSPARRGFYQYMQAPGICADVSGAGNRIIDGNFVGNVADELLLQHRPLSTGALNTLTTEGTQNVGVHCVSQRAFEHLSQMCGVEQIENVYKTKDSNGAAASLCNDYGGSGNGVTLLAAGNVVNNHGNFCTDDSDTEYLSNNERRTANGSGAVGVSNRFMNTLPTRKIKKRIIENAGSIAKCTNSNPMRSQQQQQQQLLTAAAQQRINAQRILPESSNASTCEENDADGNGDGNGNIGLPNAVCVMNNNNDNRSTLQTSTKSQASSSLATMHHKKLPASDGCENSGYLNNSNECGELQQNGNGSTPCGHVDDDGIINCDTVPYEDPTESEIYFADVSSCCNMSLRNGNCYEDANRMATQFDQNRMQRATPKHQHKHQHSNCSQSSNASCCNQRDEQRNMQRQQQHQNQHQRHDIECYNNSKKYKQHFATNRSPMNHHHQHHINSINNNNNNDTLTSRYDNNPINNAMEKDASMQSLCSMETIETDLSPVPTPSNNTNNRNNNNNNSSSNNLSDFIAALPELKLHGHEHQQRFPASSTSSIIQDAHYEVINDGGIMTTTSMSPQPQCQQRARNVNVNNAHGQGSLNRRKAKEQHMMSHQHHHNHHQSQRSTDGNIGGIGIGSSTGGGSGRHRQRI